MEAVTFPQSKVVRFVMDHVIPVRVPHDQKPLSEQYQVKWTPTLLTLDAEGREHHRTVGFLPAEDLMASILLGQTKVHFDAENFQEALKVLEALLSEFPKSSAAPEALFLRGVCRYKSTHDPKPLKEAYEKLSSTYPDSEWTKRAYPYRLL
jgi:tetratricopeptide (TPR) repeat protein